MNLSPHFALEEFTASQTASRLGLNNTPDPTAMQNLQRLAYALEEVRTLLNNRPILISSGFRAPRVNAAVGGVPNSAHVDGLAADFISPGFGTPLEICRAIEASAIVFDQIIQEGTWVHFAIADKGKPARRQVLTARFGNGPTRYTQGLD